MSSKMYIKKQLTSTDGSKVIYPQTKAEIVWREDLSSTVENSLKVLENTINNLGSDSGDDKIENISASGAAPLTLSASKDNTNVTITGSIAVATSNTAGIMSAEDKAKLDGISNSADSVSFTRNLTSGTKIGTITINGTGTDLYCQTSTSSSDTTKVTAGKGLTGGGSANSSTGVTLNVGAGTGISVGADTVSLATYGTASTYGPSANATLSHSGTFTVPKITTDAYGRITASNITYTLPASGNTDTKVKQTAYSTSANLPILTCTTASPSSGSAYGTYYDTGVYINHNTKTLTATKVYGAVWNDYAEYRAQKEEIEPGYCVASGDDGKIYKTSEKFQACDGIVSDTFGFGIGETDKCKTPLAVAGRVLAYAENPEELHSGDTVCAGPNGKVVKMTREEIREWPDRIVGVVSEIPAYETWGTGNVKVDGRIWIKVR